MPYYPQKQRHSAEIWQQAERTQALSNLAEPDFPSLPRLFISCGEHQPPCSLARGGKHDVTNALEAPDLMRCIALCDGCSSSARSNRSFGTKNIAIHSEYKCKNVISRYGWPCLTNFWMWELYLNFDFSIPLNMTLCGVNCPKEQKRCKKTVSERKKKTEAYRHCRDFFFLINLLSAIWRKSLLRPTTDVSQEQHNVGKEKVKQREMTQPQPLPLPRRCWFVPF